MKKEINTANLEAIGLKHWTKNGMDRIYINLDGNYEYSERPLRCFFNRIGWQNLKVYWDVAKSELVITSNSDDAIAAVTAVVTDLVNGCTRYYA